MSAAFLLRLMQDVQNDAFLAGQAIADVGYVVVVVHLHSGTAGAVRRALPSGSSWRKV